MLLLEVGDTGRINYLAENQTIIALIVSVIWAAWKAEVKAYIEEL